MIAQPLAVATRIAGILFISLLLQACSGGASVQPDVAERRGITPAPTTGERAVHIALRQVGVPYQYGGQSPSGFDCSGLVHYSYSQAGVAVARTTGQLWSSTTPVAREDIRKGDLLFFSINGKMQHVGLYIGNGQFVHAPSTGRVVSVETLSSTYYRNAFLRAGRPR